MKKLIHNLRIWLLEMLGGVDMAQAAEWEARAEAKANEYYKGQIACYRDHLRKKAQESNELRKVIQEMCRRSENSYYDWCCEYCSTDCEWPAHWCARFEP